MDDPDEYDEVDEDEGEEHPEPEVTIEVSGLSLFTHVGVTAAEREVGQRLLLDLRIDVGECDATVTDRIEDTVDYAQVCDTANLVAQQRSYKTLERLCAAIADRLIEEAMAGLEPRACWVDTVIEGTRRLRAVYLAHPAAAWLSASRTTHGPGEMQAVNLLIGAVLEAGFEGAEAVRIYRALGDFALFWAGGEAGFLALDERAQATERAAWTAYLGVDRAEFPNIWQVRLDLLNVADDAIFDTILSLVVGGLMQQAPRPCGCGAHLPGEAAAGRGGASPAAETCSADAAGTTSREQPSG